MWNGSLILGHTVPSYMSTMVWPGTYTQLNHSSPPHRCGAIPSDRMLKRPKAKPIEFCHVYILYAAISWFIVNYANKLDSIQPIFIWEKNRKSKFWDFGHIVITCALLTKGFFSLNTERHGAYWVTQKLPQIYTAIYATFPIQIGKIIIQICGNFWGIQYMR